MKNTHEILKDKRVTKIELGIDGGAVFVKLPYAKKPMAVVFSRGGGWDHVSASYDDRCPTWQEMCDIKDIFFGEHEWALQYHPAKEDYVNNHPYCLHLWRPQKERIPKPPKIFVGI